MVTKFKKRGLEIYHEGKIYRIGQGKDIDRDLRIQLMRENRRMDEEIERRERKSVGD